MPTSARGGNAISDAFAVEISKAMGWPHDTAVTQINAVFHTSADGFSRMARPASGFSGDAGVCIEARDRAALERLLRYCARLTFAYERLRKEGAPLVYRCAKQQSEPSSDKPSTRVDELHLTPLELIERIAALVPPPRTHRHHYFGVLAPNSPLSAAAVALAQPAKPVVAKTEPAATVEGALPVGGVARPHLRSVPAAVPNL